MDIIFLNWVLLIGIFTLALASPGPDFIIAVRYALLYSRKMGIMAALGFAIGVAVHVTYVLFGLAALIASSATLFTIIKFIGAAYLFYIGIQSLRSKGTEDQKLKPANHKSISLRKAFVTGFLTNLLNPKATMFFLAVFSQFINADTAITTQILYASTCVIMTFLWFSFVAIVLSNSTIKQQFLKFTKWIDKICGVLLIGLSVKLFFTSNPN